MPGDERLAACGHHRFGDGVGERPQAFAAPGGKDHDSHFSSSNNRLSGVSALYLLAASRA
jgi:hypothetical protein